MHIVCVRLFDSLSPNCHPSCPTDRCSILTNIMPCWIVPTKLPHLVCFIFHSPTEPVLKRTPHGSLADQFNLSQRLSEFANLKTDTRLRGMSFEETAVTMPTSALTASDSPVLLTSEAFVFFFSLARQRLHVKHSKSALTQPQL